MKSKLTLMCAMIAISLFLFACSPSVDVSCDDFMNLQHISQETEVAVGDSFTVNLASNRRIAFLWSESAQISDQTVLQQTNHELVPTRFPTLLSCGLGGTEGKEVWTFQALKKGESTVSMENRPWNDGEEVVWTFNLTVTVR